jgi:hypothetical protein
MMPGLLTAISHKLNAPAKGSRQPSAPVNPAQQTELVSLCRELLHGLEQFVIATPDLSLRRTWIPSGSSGGCAARRPA